MQECRKYKTDNWLEIEEEKQIDKIIKQLVNLPLLLIGYPMGSQTGFVQIQIRL